MSDCNKCANILEEEGQSDLGWYKNMQGTAMYGNVSPCAGDSYDTRSAAQKQGIKCNGYPAQSLCGSPACTKSCTACNSVKEGYGKPKPVHRKCCNVGNFVKVDHTWGVQPRYQL